MEKNIKPPTYCGSKRSVEYCCLRKIIRWRSISNTVHNSLRRYSATNRAVLDNGKRKVMLAKPKILVVDDDRVIASTLATILDGQGYETLTAYSGEEAVHVACSFQPKLLLSDISMGALSGVDAAMSILTFLPHCKVLFASGHASCADVLENARAQGFNFEVLTKPVPPPELLAKISHTLEA